MPNILDRYPNARIRVKFANAFIDPADYESEGITVTVTNGVIELSAPEMGGGGGVYDVVIEPQGPTIAEPVRVVVLEFPGELPGESGISLDGVRTQTSSNPPDPPVPFPYLITDQAGWFSVGVYGSIQGV
ncbi:hypothetical protein [Lysobacter sp. CA199]|uniref:hypothetical protein n=1 Tax=Lysobacter sp. CA199 TaxID=3455608 RepID=UPI003F8CF287